MQPDLSSELSHLLDAPRTDHVDDDTGDVPADDDGERRADQRGRDLLIDPDRYRDFVRTGRFGTAEVRALAHELGISPGIVVGRLQRDDQVPPNRLNGLKKRLTWT